MNNFIVWDKRYKVFRKLLKIDFQLGLYFCIDTVVPFEKGELIKNIDLKDINGKNIYADSSIVEFEFYNSSNKWEKIIGYFKYIPECFCYVVIALCNSYSSIPISTLANRNIKIIDTIQENKSGLIK